MKIEIDVDCEDGFKYKGFNVSISSKSCGGNGNDSARYTVKGVGVFEHFYSLTEAINFIDDTYTDLVINALPSTSSGLVDELSKKTGYGKQECLNALRVTDSDPDSVVRSEKYYSFTPEMQEIVDAIVEKHREGDLKTISMYEGVVEKCKKKYEEINSYKNKIKSLEVDLKWSNKEDFESKQRLLDFNKQPWYTRVLLAIKGGV